VAYLEPFMEAEKAIKAKAKELVLLAAAVPEGQDVTLGEGFTYTPYPDLSPLERNIERKFASDLAADLEGMAKLTLQSLANVLDRKQRPGTQP